MQTNRRNFLRGAGTLGAVAGVCGLAACEAPGPIKETAKAGPLDRLEPMLNGVSPVTVAEREAGLKRRTA